MSTFLLTWNPARWHWSNIEDASEQTIAGTPFSSRWSTGNTKRIARGDRVFLLKQGQQPRGVIAAGWVTSEEVYEHPHYDPARAAQGDTALRADVDFELILNPSAYLPLSVEEIEDGPLANVYWQTPASGIELSDDAAAELEGRWTEYLHSLGLSQGVSSLSPEDAESHPDGSRFTPSDEDSREVIFRQIKARRGQQAFRNALRTRYGDRCMISGCRLLDVVEAAHIKPYRGEPDNHPANGLLLRADLHTLFDLDFIGIEPDTLIVRVHPDAIKAGFAQFDGVQLTCGAAGPSSEALTLRWEAFQRKNRSHVGSDDAGRTTGE